MKKLLLIFMILFASCSWAEEKFIELRVPCKENSEAEAILPDGEKISLGRVLMTPSKTNWPAYTASKWSEKSSVCASAVNAVHILLNIEKDRGRIISLVPSVTIAPAAGRGSFFSIECEAGTGLFGRYYESYTVSGLVADPFGGLESNIALIADRDRNLRTGRLPGCNPGGL